MASFCLAGTPSSSESTVHGNGSPAQVPGLATVAVGTADDLFAVPDRLSRARLARALPGEVGRVRAYGVTGSHRRPRGGFGRCRPGRAVVPGRAGADRRAGFAS